MLNQLFQKIRAKAKPSSDNATHHKDSEHEIELAFDVEGEKFYAFKDPLLFTSHARYFYIGEYLTCIEYRITPKLRELYFDMVQTYAMRISQEADQHKREQLAKTLMIATQQYEARYERLPDTEILLEVAVRAFFKKDDNLAELPDSEELERRKGLLKKKGLAFLLSKQPLSSIFALAKPLAKPSQALQGAIEASSAHLTALTEAIQSSLKKGK